MQKSTSHSLTFLFGVDSKIFQRNVVIKIASYNIIVVAHTFKRSSDTIKFKCLKYAKTLQKSYGDCSAKINNVFIDQNEEKFLNIGDKRPLRRLLKT